MNVIQETFPAGGETCFCGRRHEVIRRAENARRADRRRKGLLHRSIA